jgi:hypothetical protein
MATVENFKSPKGEKVINFYDERRRCLQKPKPELFEDSQFPATNESLGKDPSPETVEWWVMGSDEQSA